ncbi:MAG: cyclic nucleotide-binding domain-containing protein [Deltaproteobacteria bacterium]|nr:cyclic nucleotide-binding domain-containing protein [Deltaproteobacteria bacterium]
MAIPKNVRKGDVILKEGEKPGTIYIIQSGMVSVFLPKQKKNIELYKAGVGQIVGEEALFGLPLTASVAAVNDVSLIEVRVDAVKPLLDAANPTVKHLLKSVIDKQKAFNGELKTLKADQDLTPCPPDNTAKVFACLFHVAKYYGEKKDNKIVIQWEMLKRFAQRMFLESPLRLEQAFNILLKLKLAEVQMVKVDPKPQKPGAPKPKEEELLETMGACTFHDLVPVERFFEFYAQFHFKGANPTILKYDDKCNQVVKALVQISEGERQDKSGVVYMKYTETCDKMKAIIGPSFTADTILRLEQKGLFVKRESNNQGGTLSFFRQEFINMGEAWKILREVEKWNELGFVDMSEPKPVLAPGAVGADGAPLDPNKAIVTCPACLSAVGEAAKFCHACGQKLTAQAA